MGWRGRSSDWVKEGERHVCDISVRYVSHRWKSKYTVWGRGCHSKIVPEIWIQNGYVKIQHIFRMIFEQINKNSPYTVEENEQRTSISNLQNKK